MAESSRTPPFLDSDIGLNLVQAFPTALILTSIPFLASMAFTPGPNNILVASSGVNFGFRATVPHILGVSFGYPVMLLLVGIGLAKVFAAAPEVHLVLKYVCVLYLLYLAWRIASAAAPGREPRVAGEPLTFLQAAAFQWVNGKGWVVALSAVTTYTVVESSLLEQVVTLAGIALIVTAGAVTCWTLFGAMLRQYLHTDRRRRAFNYSMAALLVLSIIPVFWE
jgi:threonine/homoserine/homoserine lactone efflux protein